MAKCNLWTVLANKWPDDLYIICASDQLIKPNDVSSIFPTMVGWKIRVSKNGQPLWLGTNANGNGYFDYTAITAEATWSYKAEQGDEFIIKAYKPA